MDARIARMRLGGETQTNIAKSLGVGVTTVFFRLQRLGFPKRAKAFIHGEPVSGRHFWLACHEFDLPGVEAAQQIGVSKGWAHQRLKLKRMKEPLSRKLSSKTLKLWNELKAGNQSGSAAGRAWPLTPNEQTEIPEKYESLVSELKVLRLWVSRQETYSAGKLWDFLCEGFWPGQFNTLRFWPQFFRWLERESFTSSFRSGLWRPPELAIQFLAEDYRVTKRAIYEAIYDKNSARIPVSGRPKS